MLLVVFYFFFFNDTATTEIYTLSLHDALPISDGRSGAGIHGMQFGRPSIKREYRSAAHSSSSSDHRADSRRGGLVGFFGRRSEEHTSELQSQSNLVCRLLLEKKNTTTCSMIYV